MKLTPAALALATFAMVSPARAQPAPVTPSVLASARCRVRESFGRAPAAAFAPDGSVFALVVPDTLALTLYDAATCAQRASTTIVSDLPPTARFLEVLVASPAMVLLLVNGALFRWTGRDHDPVTPLALHAGECTAWVHGPPGRVYAAFTEHIGPDVDRSRVVAIDSVTGRAVARSAWLPVAWPSLTYDPAGRALFALVPQGRAWRIATPSLRAQALMLSLRSTQERRRFAPTSDGYLAGAYDTARERFAPYSIQGAAPDGALLLVSTSTPETFARWRPGTALPASDQAARPGDAATHALALGAGGALIVHHATQQVVSVHTLP